jgi:intein/homing endonuclease
MQKYLEDYHHLNPLPVYHQGEDLKWFKKYVDNYDYIGVGGLGQLSTKSRWFLNVGNSIFNIICDDRGMPQRKLHGFAMTSPDLVIEFPFYSTDSVMGNSLILVREFGRIRVSTIENLYRSSLGKKVKTSSENSYKEAIELETFVTDENGEGKWAKVSKIIRHSVGKSIYNVKTYGGRFLNLTKDHGCFVKRDGFIEVVQTDKILPVRDRLIAVNYSRKDNGTLRELTINVDRKSAANNKDKTKRIILEKLPFTIKFTKELMEFFGLWIADGYHRGLAIGMSCANDSECLEIVRKVSSYFDFAYNHKVKVSNNKVDCIISNSFFQRVMIGLGLVGNSHTKEVPWWVFELPDDLICAFLRGYFSGDGSVSSKKKFSVSACTVSPKLFYGLTQLLSSQGIDSLWRHIEGKTGGFSKGRDVLFHIRIGNLNNYRLFRSKVGFLQKFKNEKLETITSTKHKINMSKKTNDFFSKRNDELHLRCLSVRSKSLSFKRGFVYDLEIPDGQRFVANGLLVHNSTSWMQFGKYGMIIVPKKRNGKFIFEETPHIVLVSARKEQKAKEKHFDNLPLMVQNYIIEYIESKGLRMGESSFEEVPFSKDKPKLPLRVKELSGKEVILEEGVCNSGKMRDILNLHYYLDLESCLEWPRYWKRKRAIARLPI